jgi:hypothetical protein
MKKNSNYVGMRIGDWICTYYGVARVQSVYTSKKDEAGKSVKSKRPGHRAYYYIFERLTSDKKAMKMIRLTAAQVKKVKEGQLNLDVLADKKAAKRSPKFIHKVSYSFCD